jgi:hypothetical protein
VKDLSTRELFAGFFVLVALVAGLIELFYRPLAFGPLGLLALIVAVMMTPRFRALYGVGVVLLSIGFVVGAAVAVALENPLF